jgi:hypothetical protein
MQWFGKHATTIETVFSAWSVPRIILKTIGATREMRVQLWSVNQRATEAEESPWLRFVARKRLVKTRRREL